MSVQTITNGVITVGVDADMRVDNLTLGSGSLWDKTVDILTYKDFNDVTESFTLKDLAWTIVTVISGATQTIKGTAIYTNAASVPFLDVTYQYSVTIGIDHVTADIDVKMKVPGGLHFIRGSHTGRITVNTGTNPDKVTDRQPRHIFQKDIEIDYLDYIDDSSLQAIWTGTVVPTRSINDMGGNSTASMQIVLNAGTHTISRAISSEDWTLVNTIFAGINAIALTGDNHKIRLFWVSNGITYFSKFRVIDSGEPFKTNWRLFHLRHFYLDILTGIDKSSVTQFGFEIVTDGATLLIDELWRYEKQDILPDLNANATDFHDVLPFFNANVPWDRRQAEEVFVLGYADETSSGGNIKGVAWIGEWRPTSDIIIIQRDKATNSRPLSIGGQVKYLPVGIDMEHWTAKWHILPFVADTAIVTMYVSAKSLYESKITDLNFPVQSKFGIGESSVQPYIWNALEDPFTILKPKLQEYITAGVTDLIIPIGNSGWGSWKSRVWRYDIANTVREKGDDRLNFIINMWLDPAFPDRRVFLESTIFDNHWLKDESDERTVFNDVTTGDSRVFVYEAADARELYITRAFLPIDPLWFNDQVVDGVTYVFSYQYPRFRPSLAHIANAGSVLSKDINIHDRWLQRINDVVKGYNISGIVISEWFWYKRGFDATSLSMYNQYRATQSLPILTDFNRLDNNLPAVNGSNEYIADDRTVWSWKNTETTKVISAIKALLTPRDLRLWISSNIDNIIAVEDKNAPVWSGIGMIDSVPIGNKAFTYNNARHSTDFNILNANTNLDMMWCWNYWGFSRIEAIFEFIQKYCSTKTKVSMVLGVFPRSSPPSAADLQAVIITARTYGMRISFAGDRNYTPEHFTAMKAGMAAVITVLPCPVTKKKKVLGKIKFPELEDQWGGKWEQGNLNNG